MIITVIVRLRDGRIILPDRRCASKLTRGQPPSRRTAKYGEHRILHIVDSDSRLGPFTKSQDPVVASNDVAAGPGHCALVRTGPKIWMLYHAWRPGAVGSELPAATCG
jgi:hypothetical protein